MITLSYLNLITSEHRDKPKYIAMLTGLFDEFVTCANQMDGIKNGLDPDMAVGKQLDMLGEYIGQDRRLSVSIEGLDSVLEDDDYRFLLKAKIMQNSWDGTIEQIYDLWKELFGDVSFTLIDNQDMSCTFNISPAGLTPIQIQMILANLIIPKPAGVRYNFEFLSRVLFAYDMNNDYYKGYDLGYWNGEFLTFALDVGNDAVGTILAGLDLGQWAFISN